MFAITSFIGNQFMSIYRRTSFYAIDLSSSSRFISRYIEIFRSTEQQMMRSLMQSTNRNSFGGRSSNNGNFSSNGNNRMHPYERNGNNNFGRGNGNNMRGRNQNMRNDFRRGKHVNIFCYQSHQIKNEWEGKLMINWNAFQEIAKIRVIYLCKIQVHRIIIETLEIEMEIRTTLAIHSAMIVSSR